MRIGLSRQRGAERDVFLLAKLVFQSTTLGGSPRSRALGLVALAILAVAGVQLTLIVGIALPGAVLIAVAIGDTLHDGARTPSRSA
jgi:hypothetical protein